MTWDLRLGDWRDVLADVECDAVITDPPYSQRTEDGFRTRRDLNVRGLGYDHIDRDYAFEFVRSWSTRCRGWMVVCCDHISARWFEESMQESGRYVFPPLPIVKIGAAPRLSNDGPASQSETMVVSRPREKRFLSWGSLPGWYAMQTVRNGHDTHGVSGAKSVDVMRAIVRDYSRPGDVVCDPHIGSGTTLVAARLEGRLGIGSERLPKHYNIARKRLEAGYTPPLFQDERPKPQQSDLFGADDD